MIAVRIKELRQELGLTQKKFAEKISCTSKSVWAYENSIALPPIDVLMRMANFFECSLDYLTGRSDEMGVVVENVAQRLTKQEQQLISSFKKMSDKQKSAVLDIIQTLTNSDSI